MTDEPNDAQFVLRLPTSLLERVDAWATKRRKETGENVSRADAMRFLLVRALGGEAGNAKIAHQRARKET
jgi:hypothetical protein